MKVEVVIVSYDRGDVLEETVRSLRRLYPDLPVCLGLQGADAPSIADRFGDDPWIRVICLEVPSVTGTLDRCMMSSSADLALMLDDDAVPCAGWLEAHVAAFEADPDLPYSAGREVRTGHGRSIPSDILRIGIESLLRPFLPKDTVLNGRVVGWLTSFGLLLGNLDQPGSCVINAPRGCNMAVRLSAFRAAGGFSTAFRGNAWGFEPEFGVRLAREGRLGRYVGDAVVLHREAKSGGTRKRQGRAWFDDYLHNHRVLIATLGRFGWLGAMPRLALRWLKVRAAPADLRAARAQPSADLDIQR